MTKSPQKQPKDIYGEFRYRARSDAAKALVNDLYEVIIKAERRGRRRRQRDAVSFKETVERFIAQLLRSRAQKSEEYSGRFYRSMQSKTFTGDVVSLRNLTAVIEALKRLCFLTQTGGHPSFGPGFEDKTQQWKGEASKFEATQKLIDHAANFSVLLYEIDKHFRVVHDVIEAKKASKSDWRNKQKAKLVKFTHTPHTTKLEQEVTALNDFLSSFRIEGAQHDALYRVFNEYRGDGTYRWNKGGRLYSDGGLRGYQNLPGSERARITIDGEQTVELDIAASNLTIFHGLMGRPLDLSSERDPYTAIHPNRDLVKAWMTASFGQGHLINRWSPDLSQEYADANEGVRPSALIKARELRQQAIKVYPALAGLDTGNITWADLMFVESNIIVSTMVHLMNTRIPALPVHDALIVGEHDALEGAKRLYEHFRHEAKAAPLIKVKNASEAIKKEVEGIVEEYINW